MALGGHWGPRMAGQSSCMGTSAQSGSCRPDSVSSTGPFLPQSETRKSPGLLSLAQPSQHPTPLGTIASGTPEPASWVPWRPVLCAASHPGECRFESEPRTCSERQYLGAAGPPAASESRKRSFELVA